MEHHATSSLNQLSDEINKALSQYSDEIADKVDKTVKIVSNELCDELKTTSPKRTGKYKDGWEVDFTGRKKGNRSAVIHNEQYRLTHLLEFGHAKRSGGRVSAYPHIANAEKKYIDIFQKRVEEILNEN